MSHRREWRSRGSTPRRAALGLASGTVIRSLAVGVLALAILAGLVVMMRPSASRPAGDAGAPGRLEARPVTIDLGRVPFDRLVEARYELVNTGGQPVRLLGAPAVKTLEGC